MDTNEILVLNKLISNEVDKKTQVIENKNFKDYYGKRFNKITLIGRKNLIDTLIAKELLNNCTDSFIIIEYGTLASNMNIKGYLSIKNKIFSFYYSESKYSKKEIGDSMCKYFDVFEPTIREINQSAYYWKNRIDKDVRKKIEYSKIDTFSNLVNNKKENQLHYKWYLNNVTIVKKMENKEWEVKTTLFIDD